MVRAGPGHRAQSSCALSCIAAASVRNARRVDRHHTMSTPLPIFIVLIVVSAALTIAGDYIQPRRPWLIYTFKPGTTALILALVLASGTFMSTPYARWVFIGLLFSLMGDIWLMLPQDRFLYGLASFL